MGSMKNLMKVALLTCLVSILALSACEEEAPFEEIDRSRTYLHFLNAFPGSESVDITFETFDNNRTVAKDVPFSDSWPNNGYANLLTSPDTLNGQGGVLIRVLDHNTQEELVPPLYKNLGAEGQFTFVLVDSFSKPVLVKAIDNLDEEFNPGNAYARFMNINRHVQSSSLVNQLGEEVLRGLNYLNYSTFQQIDPGTYTFYFVDDISGAKLDSVSNVQIRLGKIYSFYLTHQQARPVGGLKIMENKDAE